MLYETVSLNSIWQILGLSMQGRNFDNYGYLVTQGLPDAGLPSKKVKLMPNPGRTHSKQKFYL